MFWKKSPAAALAALLLIHLLAHIDRNMLLGFSPQIIRDLSLSNTQYGFLVGGVWVLSFGVMAMVMGTLADRYSRTRVIAAGVLIWSICTWASGHAQDFGHLVIARFFVASGEAALVPAAISLLAELFPEKRRSSAMGIFFMGIPLGVGFAFLLAGVFGGSHGWRFTFKALGVVGIVVAVAIAVLKDERRHQTSDAHSGKKVPWSHQVKTMFSVVKAHRSLQWLIVGFVLVHFYFAGLSFTQLWAVQERGLDAASMSARIGLLQIVFGTLGSLMGGVLGDRLARRLPGGHATLMALIVALCAVPMIAYRFAAPDSPLFYVGMCAGIFLPLALYGPYNAAAMSLVTDDVRSTISGFSMLSINLFAITIGNLAAGWAVDTLKAQGVTSPLTTVLLTVDAISLASFIFFVLAAMAAMRPSSAMAGRVPASI